MSRVLVITSKRPFKGWPEIFKVLSFRCGRLELHSRRIKRDFMHPPAGYRGWSEIKKGGPRVGLGSLCGMEGVSEKPVCCSLLKTGREWAFLIPKNVAPGIKSKRQANCTSSAMGQRPAQQHPFVSLFFRVPESGLKPSRALPDTHHNQARIPVRVPLPSALYVSPLEPIGSGRHGM